MVVYFFSFFLLRPEFKICKLLGSMCTSVAGHLGTHMHDCKGKRGHSTSPELTWQSQNSWYAHSESCFCNFHPQTLEVYLPPSMYIEQVALTAVLFFFLMQCASMNIINDTTASLATPVLTFLWMLPRYYGCHL